MSRALAKASRGGLAKYNPGKGVQKIAVFAAAEKHWARAKDAEKLQQTIRAKLTEQAEFIYWWDSRDKNKGAAQPRNTRSDIALPDAKLAERLGTSLNQISRWRRKLNEPEKFEATCAHAIARYGKILEFETIDAQLKASESNEWYTPAKYVEAARLVLGAIDIDPASSPVANRTVQAAQFFSLQDDGLARDWPGRVWLNPPYGGLSAPFTARLLDQFAAGTTTAAVLLVNANSTDAGWFQNLWDYLLCFTDHRINFVAPAGEPQSGSTHGSVFAYLGDRRAAFIEYFSPFGAIVERAR